VAGVDRRQDPPGQVASHREGQPGTAARPFGRRHHRSARLIISTSEQNQFRQAALDYHQYPAPGKLAIAATKGLLNQRDLSLAYSPGVAAPCEEIIADPGNAHKYTARGNLVAVISNGTAVLGLGNIGAPASKPVMEGKAVLFKKFAGVDVFDIEIDEQDPVKLVEVIAALEPTFSAINLEDIKAPDCFYVERELRKRMKIPVFHDDQHGTAITVAAAMLNGLKVAGKHIAEVKLVASGAGAAALACLNLLLKVGLKCENVFVTDLAGVVYEGRVELMDEDKRQFAQKTDARSLSQVIAGADVFLGLSAGGVLKPAMVARMAPRPVIFALAKVHRPGDRQAARDRGAFGRRRAHLCLHELPAVAKPADLPGRHPRQLRPERRGACQPSALKMRHALALLRERAPGLDVDGEMHGDMALDAVQRGAMMPKNTLNGNANLLVFPNIDAANIAYNLLKTAAGGNLAIAPVLLGAAAPVHVLTASATVRRIVNMTALTVADANVERTAGETSD